jgi:fluoride exporter
MTYVWVALGGALGSLARYGSALLAARFVGVGFPWGTLLVNVFGSLAIGVAASLTAAAGKPLLAGDTRAFVIVGLLGGFTTFSSFSLETLTLARAGAGTAAALNALGSLVLCLAAAWLGFALATLVNR